MNIYVFDLDNTILDTYPSLSVIRKQRFQLFRLITETIRVSKLEFFPNMLKVVKKRMAKKNTEIIFLSARNISLWLPTYFSLIPEIGFIKPSQLILVPEAAEKIKILNAILSKDSTHKLTVIDDLSYNHEFGSIKYYTDVINFCLNNPRIRYIGKNTIDKINNA